MEYTSIITIAQAPVGDRSPTLARGELVQAIREIAPEAEARLVLADRLAYTFRISAPWSTATEAAFASMFGARNMIKT